VAHDVHLLLAVARMRATEAFAKEVSLLYDVPASEDEDDENSAADNNDKAGESGAGARKDGGDPPDAFSLLRAAALLTAALHEPQLSYTSDVVPALDAAAAAAGARLLRRGGGRGPGGALAFLRRSARPETEGLEALAAAVASALRHAGLRENVADAHDPRNFALDRDVLRALRACGGGGGGANDGGGGARGGGGALEPPRQAAAATGPAMAAVLFAEVARRLDAGVALAGTHDRPLLRLFDRRAAEAAPTSADVSAGDGAASAWAETPRSSASSSSASSSFSPSAGGAAVTPVVPPPSILVDPCAALSAQEGDFDGSFAPPRRAAAAAAAAAADGENDDDAGDSPPPPEHTPFTYAWLPEAAAWVPTDALDRPDTHPHEPPRAWPMLEPVAAPPLATRALLHAALSAAKRSHAASGRFGDALAACRLARRVDPLDLDELRDEGALLVGCRRYAEGAAALRGYLSAAPGGGGGGGPPDRRWVEAEASRAEAMAELEAMRARRALQARAQEEGEGGEGGQ